MNRKLRTWICFLIVLCIIFGIFVSFNNLESINRSSRRDQDSESYVQADESSLAPKITPKNIHIFLKSTNSSIDCLVEHIVRKYVDYKIYIYFDPSLGEHPKSIETLVSAYNNIEVKENKFNYDKFLSSNFSQHSRLTFSFLSRLKSIILSGEQPLDKQLVPMLELWRNGGYYFSVNVSMQLVENTQSLNELYNFYCEQILLDTKGHTEKHKVCKINFLKVNELDCMVELAIKNYLLYYEKHKIYNFNRMYMNLYNNQNKILSKKNQISQNPYLMCFRSKLKAMRRPDMDTLEHLFRFSSNVNSEPLSINEDNCPLIYSTEKNN